MALEATHPSLRPNYGEDWRGTYLRYTEYFIREGSGLRALYLSSADSASVNKQSGVIPSWVPDFSFEGKRIWLANIYNEVHGEATTGGKDIPSLRINMFLQTLLIQVL